MRPHVPLFGVVRCTFRCLRINFGFEQEFEGGCERIFTAVAAQDETNLAVAPIVCTTNRPYEKFRKLRKPETAEYLSRVIKIDWNRIDIHLPAFLATLRDSTARDACWSAERKRASHHASPHGPSLA